MLFNSGWSFNKNNVSHTRFLHLALKVVFLGTKSLGIRGQSSMSVKFTSSLELPLILQQSNTSILLLFSGT